MLMLSKVAANFFDLTIEKGKFYSIICHVIDVRELQQSTRYKLWYFDEKVKVKLDYRVLDVAKSIGILSYYYNLFIQKLYSFSTKKSNKDNLSNISIQIISLYIKMRKTTHIFYVSFMMRCHSSIK